MPRLISLQASLVFVLTGPLTKNERLTRIARRPPELLAMNRTVVYQITLIFVDGSEHL